MKSLWSRSIRGKQLPSKVGGHFALSKGGTGLPLLDRHSTRSLLLIFESRNAYAECTWSQCHAGMHERAAESSGNRPRSLCEGVATRGAEVKYLHLALSLVQGDYQATLIS
jgi:hypothetical protein